MFLGHDHDEDPFENRYGDLVRPLRQWRRREAFDHDLGELPRTLGFHRQHVLLLKVKPRQADAPDVDPNEHDGSEHRSWKRASRRPKQYKPVDRGMLAHYGPMC